MPPHPPSPLTRSIALATQAAIEGREAPPPEDCGNNHNCKTCWNRGPQTGQSGVDCPHRRFVILGESPGSDELNNIPPTPFVGETGQILRRAIRVIDPTLNIDKQCLLINAINCDANNKFWKDEEQKRKLTLAMTCRERVMNEIFWHNRDLVLAFGNINLWIYNQETTQRISSHPRVWQSFTCPGHRQPIPILHTLHPASILHAKGNTKIKRYMRFCRDLQEAIGVYNGGTRRYPQI